MGMGLDDAVAHVIEYEVQASMSPSKSKAVDFRGPTDGVHSIIMGAETFSLYHQIRLPAL
jgi:predicted secreted Zn-dependent protease